ncbi:MAG: TonB-dependent receptor [bacterium]
MKSLTSVVLTLFCVTAMVAQEAIQIRGRVIDKETRQPLPGANIVLVGSRYGTTTTNEGVFELRNIPTGTYTVQASYIGYRAGKITIKPEEHGPIEFLLEQILLPGQTIVVTATRVRERENPVAFSTITSEELLERYTTQDIPQLLSELPSTTFYSENGNGIGYNYLNIRGFDQRRIAVMINGIPQNDPEDHNVYWLDFPDLVSNVQDIQVQRGGGNAFYGQAAIGGSVNLITTTFTKPTGVDVSTGVGSYATRKYSIAINSGLVGERYQFYGRLSRLLSAGYREQSWIDFSSYFLGAVRYDKTMTTQFNFYGGPIADHLTYYGISKDDAYSSDNARRRRNPLARSEEIENFSQPHYELLHEWRFSDGLIINNALFLVTGEGFFDYDGSWAPYSYYRITPANGFSVNGDPDNQYIPGALVHAVVRNVQYGWLPRATLLHQHGELTVGAEFRLHRSQHWGSLRWGAQLPLGVTPDYRYYEYRGRKEIFSLSAHELYTLNPVLNLQLDLQYVLNEYRLHDEKYIGTDFSMPYHFLNPRIGLNYNIDEQFHVYSQVARTSREPRLKNLYDAAEASTPESLGPVTPQFSLRTDRTYDFTSPLVRPEKLTSVELGAGYRKGDINISVNLYMMEFIDEIIKKGQLDRFGQPVTGNAEKTRHLGIELSGSAKVLDLFDLSGNATFSQNRLIHYTVFQDSEPFSLDGNSIAGFPDFLANVRATYHTGDFFASLALQHVGEFATDNFQRPGKANPDRMVDAYTVVHGWLSYRLNIQPVGQELELKLQVNNLFNSFYAAHGEGDEFFPAADRNLFASLRIKL